MNKRNTWFTRWSFALVTLMVGASACGPQAFVPSVIRSRQSAAGSTTIPAKVDVVFGVSQNQTMLNAYPAIQQTVPAFLQNLENSGWDYRFVGIPLGEAPIDTIGNFSLQNKISVSRYDGNTPQANWLPSYPGMDYSSAPALAFASFFLAPSFVIPAPPGNVTGGLERGLRNQMQFLTLNPHSAFFLRPDAMLAIITLSNGEDRSFGTAPAPNSGQPWTYNETDTLNAIDDIRNVKSDPDMVKYFSLVADAQTNCISQFANSHWWGQRYQSFASALNGESVNICNVPLPQAFSQVAQNIQGTALPFRRNFLVIQSEPNQATIQVFKYPNGDTNNPVTIPQDATNGWTYAGYLNGQYTIDSPISMDMRDGYMIELHGTAKLFGSDLADVVYRNVGDPSSN
ncbi:MAG: hypothetical protein KGP28_13140 [Bdellovibrionales bacterium]|nr:hypothetical protein [Bdellovibrionales bacterium]